MNDRVLLLRFDELDPRMARLATMAHPGGVALIVREAERPTPCTFQQLGTQRKINDVLVTGYVDESGEGIWFRMIAVKHNWRTFWVKVIGVHTPTSPSISTSTQNDE